MATRTADFDKLIHLILALPEGTYFDSMPSKLSIQGRSRKQVRAIRACFPGLIWKKRKNEYGGWWEYDATTSEGVLIHIYADREGPASCKRIEKVVEETVHVPANEAHDEVRKQTVVTWECPEGNEAAEVEA